MCAQNLRRMLSVYCALSFPADLSAQHWGRGWGGGPLGEAPTASLISCFGIFFLSLYPRWFSLSKHSCHAHKSVSLVARLLQLVTGVTESHPVPTFQSHISHGCSLAPQKLARDLSRQGPQRPLLWPVPWLNCWPLSLFWDDSPRNNHKQVVRGGIASLPLGCGASSMPAAPPPSPALRCFTDRMCPTDMGLPGFLLHSTVTQCFN